MVVDQTSFMKEWQFFAENIISFADLSRPIENTLFVHVPGKVTTCDNEVDDIGTQKGCWLKI